MTVEKHQESLLENPDVASELQALAKQHQPAAVVAPSGPVTLDKVDGHSTYYGVTVADIGEDSNTIYAFTHDVRRAIAAARRHIRVEHGETATEIEPHEPRYAQVFNHCGCQPHDDHEGSNCECERYGLPPCSPDTFDWLCERCNPDAANAIPVIELDWDCTLRA
jgi:hypothetical protein